MLDLLDNQNREENEEGELDDDTFEINSLNHLIYELLSLYVI